MIKSLASLLKLPSTAPAKGTSSVARETTASTAPATTATPFTLDSFQKLTSEKVSTFRGMGLKDDGVPSFGGQWTNQVSGFDGSKSALIAQGASGLTGTAIVDAVARSKAVKAVDEAARAIVAKVSQNSWVDHVDQLSASVRNAADRTKQELEAGTLSPDAANARIAQWLRLSDSLVQVPKGSRLDEGDDRSTQIRMDAQATQHHQAIRAFDGAADFESVIRLSETVAAQVPPSPANAEALGEFKKRLGVIRELSGLASKKDAGLDLGGQFPGLRDELAPRLAPVGTAATSETGSTMEVDDATPSTDTEWTNEVSGFVTPSAEAATGLSSQPTDFEESLARAFNGPRVTSTESADALAKTFLGGVVSPFSAAEDAWAQAGDSSAKRAALDAAIAKSDGVMTKELWKAMPASARDLYRANEVVASFSSNGFVNLTKDGFAIERKSMGGSGEGRFTMFKGGGLNLVVDQHMGGYEEPNGVNIGNRNLAYIYESKLRVGSDVLEFGRFEREVRLNGKAVTVGDEGLTLSDGSRLEKLKDGSGYRVSNDEFEVDLSYYFDGSTGVPARGLVHKNLGNIDDVDESQPRTFMQSFQVRNKKAGPVEAEGLLGQVMTEQSLRAPDRAVERKTGLWNMDLSPWLATDFANPA